MKTIIVIPARGNSKGIKKNLLSFSKNLFFIGQLFKQKQNLKDIYISSENEEILQFSKNWGQYYKETFEIKS